ncbi:hypothetical protein C4D60_Mb03t21730 [Musa balbisiana]|uniref:Uncharacterized protein n=1 Tax=Musa balbisiana TaxID=52838 RepID=A0A4S8JCP5_MUSBA|nr:hypothetical protein C4D60_Mb03t21730 [Musa balbisiana]
MAHAAPAPSEERFLPVTDHLKSSSAEFTTQVIVSLGAARSTSFRGESRFRRRRHRSGTTPFLVIECPLLDVRFDFCRLDHKIGDGGQFRLRLGVSSEEKWNDATGQEA